MSGVDNETAAAGHAKCCHLGHRDASGHSVAFCDGRHHCSVPFDRVSGVGLDVAAARAICAAATKGPWHVEVTGGRDYTGEGWTNIEVSFDGGDDYSGSVTGKPGLMLGDHEDAEADAEFIAAARTGWPKALDLIVVLWAEIDGLRAERGAALDEIERLRSDNDELYREQDGIAALKTFALDVAELGRPSQIMRRRRVTLDTLVAKAEQALREFDAIVNPAPVVIDAATVSPAPTERRALTVMEAHPWQECPDVDACWAADIHREHMSVSPAPEKPE